MSKVIDRVPCEFFLIRYVPDAVKGEYTNIGVLLREAGREQSTHVRFTRDWSRVRSMDADADIQLLEALESEIDERLRQGATDNKPIIGVMQDTFSNSIQMTEARACLAESVTAEMDLLMRLYVEPMRVKQQRKRTGRAAIAAEMRSQFEQAGVWAMMRKSIAAAIYTQAGDPMKIDCGYRPNGVIKMFHAVWLEGDVEAAKVLAFTAPRLREGVARVEEAKLELTAVVEALLDDDNGARYRFGVETMQSQEIRVVTTNDLAHVAEAARIELRL
jgi:hypothetical protein